MDRDEEEEPDMQELGEDSSKCAAEVFTAVSDT